MTDRTVPDPAEEPTITVPRAAEILGISKSAAYDAVKAGEIPSIRIGKRLLIPSAAIVAMIEVRHLDAVPGVPGVGGKGFNVDDIFPGHLSRAEPLNVHDLLEHLMDVVRPPWILETASADLGSHTGTAYIFDRESGHGWAVEFSPIDGGGAAVPSEEGQ